MLIRSSIDYSKIDYGTVKGVVYFRGPFRLSMAMDSHEEMKRTMTVKTLFSFEKRSEISRGFRMWFSNSPTGERRKDIGIPLNR